RQPYREIVPAARSIWQRPLRECHRTVACELCFRIKCSRYVRLSNTLRGRVNLYRIWEPGRCRAQSNSFVRSCTYFSVNSIRLADVVEESPHFFTRSLTRAGAYILESTDFAGARA